MLTLTELTNRYIARLFQSHLPPIALLVVIASLVMGGRELVAGGQFTPGGSQVFLRCAGTNRGEGDTRLSCEVKNYTQESIFVLMSDAILDGPVGEAGYVHKYAGGLRFENVLQCGVKTKRGLDRATLSDPTVDLTDEDLRRLRRVPPGGRMSIVVNVNCAGMPDNVRQADLLVRFKLVFAKELRLQAMARQTDMSPMCRQLMTSALRDIPGPEPVRVGTRRFHEGTRYLPDGCHNRISELFEHAYSEIVEVRLRQ